MHWGYYNYRPDTTPRVDTGATAKAEQANRGLEVLEEKVEALALACQAMWEILRDNTRITEEQLSKKMQEIDLRDGKLDGRLMPKPTDCKKCGRTTTRRRENCLYCGADNGERCETFARK